MPRPYGPSRSDITRSLRYFRQSVMNDCRSPRLTSAIVFAVDTLIDHLDRGSLDVDVYQSYYPAIREMVESLGDQSCPVRRRLLSLLGEFDSSLNAALVRASQRREKRKGGA